MVPVEPVGTLTVTPNDDNEFGWARFEGKWAMQPTATMLAPGRYAIVRLDDE